MSSFGSREASREEAGSSALSRRARRGRRRAEPVADEPARGASKIDLVLSCMLGTVVVGSVLAIGAVHLPILCIAAALSFVAAALAMRHERQLGTRLPGAAPAAIALALGMYSLVQAMPLPLAWVERLSPTAADVWARALLPLGEPAPQWVSLSLDPGASIVEALRWLTYAGVFATAASIASRRGSHVGITIVFGSAVVASLATVGHGLVGATKVFGLYKPVMSVSAWHLGPLLNPNNLAGYLCVGALCGLGVMMRKQPAVPRWVVGLGVATILGVSVTSGSRGGLGALVLGAAVFMALLWHQSRRDVDRRKGVAWLAVGSLAGGVTLASLASTGVTWAELYDKNLAKLEMFRWVRPMIADFPWFGSGRGSFESVFPAYRETPGNVVFTHAENFPAQWAAEWGLPVTLIALTAMAWHFNPWRFRLGSSAISAGAYLGVCALALHNLVDLGLEIPAVCLAVATTLGSLCGDPKRSADARTDAASATFPRAQWMERLRAPIAVGAGALCISMALLRGRHDLGHDRRVIRAGVDAKLGSDAVRPPLRAAMLRHPAEPYFPLMGAFVAWRSHDANPMPWLQRALERGHVQGRAHLLLAEVIAARGARTQALLQLRIATETDPGLADAVAERALRWTSSFDDLLLTVPAGMAGVDALEGLCWRLGATPSLLSRCNETVLERDPARVGPHEREARTLLTALGTASDPRCTERAPCTQALHAHVEAIRAAEPTTSKADVFEAQLLMQDGKYAEADALLTEACMRGGDRLGCEKLRATNALKGKLSDRATAALKALLALGCASAKSCADTATWAANARSAAGDHGAALTLFARAARDDPGDDRFLALADAATAAGAHRQALEALQKVAQRRGGADAALQARIDDALSKTSSHW